MTTDEPTAPWLSPEAGRADNSEPVGFRASDKLMQTRSLRFERKHMGAEKLYLLEPGYCLTFNEMPLTTARTLASRLNKKYNGQRRYRAVKHDTCVEIGRVL